MVAKIARLAGADPRPLSTHAHTCGAVREVCEALEPPSPFFGSRKYAGLHRRLVETIKELADWGFDPGSLSSLAAECSPGLSSKLVSLAEIWTKTEARLTEFGLELGYRHVAHCLAVESVTDVDFPDCLIFLDGSATPEHVRWIKWAAQIGVDGTVVTPTTGTTVNLFANSSLVQKGFGDGAYVGTAHTFVTSLFAGTVASEATLKVDRFRSSDPLAEVEWVFRRCIEAGELERVGIFARSLEEYGPLLESAAKRFQVPIRFAKRSSLKSNGYIRTLCNLLKSLAGQDVRTLEWILRSPYGHFPSELRREYIVQTAESLRSGSEAWGRLAAWLDTKPELEWLLEMVRWGHEARTNPTTLGTWRERISALGAMFPVIAEANAGERDLRAKNAFERALGARASFSQSEALTYDQLLVEVEEIAEEVDYTLPAESHGVVISDSVFGFPSVDHLFVIGMLEGVFPRRRSEDPILTDSDRAEISDRRALLFPMVNSFEVARAERDDFVSLCAVPSSSLTFSYPETTDERDNIPAFYLEEARRALGGEMAHVSYSRSLVAPLIGECIAACDKNLRTAIDAGPVRDNLDFELSDAVKAEVKSRDGSRLSIRELRTAFECPFRHFAQMRLRVFPNKERARWYQLRELPQAARLLNQPTPDNARTSLLQLMEAELEEIKAYTTDADLQLMRQGGERLIDDWIAREFRAREIWAKDVGSVRCDVSLESEEFRSEFPRVGTISGTVAGTSRMGPYKVVHLVESNTPTPDRQGLLGLKDRDALYYGAHLMAAYEQGTPQALEVESMSGERMMLLLPRVPEPQLTGDVSVGLKVVDLAEQNEIQHAKEMFFRNVKSLLERAATAIREVDVRATNGEHCSFCDHGELCRRSTEFGEEDSYIFGGANE